MTTVTVELPEPHSHKQKMLMTALLYPGLQELWCVCGTKFGKTLGGDGGLVNKALQTPNGIIRHVAPIYTQAKIGMRYCEKMLPPPPHSKPNRSGLPTIYLPDLDTSLEFWHGQEPESLEGDGVHGYLLDECAKLKMGVYASAKTTVTVTRGPIMGTSTPRGKGGKGAWFYNKCVEAKAHMEWSLKKGIPPTHVFLTAPTSENPFVAPEVIESARKSLPDRLFRQYYLAEFIDDGAIFVGVKDCVYGDLLDVYGDTQQWTSLEAKDCEVVIGADWGKIEDYTVFSAWDLKQCKMVGFLRFRGVDYISAIKNLIWFKRKFKKLIMVMHDKTGLGQVIDDALAETGLPYEGVTFTNKSKTEMVNGLMMAFQFKKIQIPHWEEMLLELDLYEVKTNALGTMSFSAPEGQHDDIVSSMFLAYQAVDEYSTPLELRFLGDEKNHIDINKEIKDVPWYEIADDWRVINE